LSRGGAAVKHTIFIIFRLAKLTESAHTLMLRIVVDKEARQARM
jgi:hypothetical protein